MPESLPPGAIRVTRPYASEDELLESELETLTRASITLLGAQPRPQGLVLRFELVLSSGQVLVRGEGRVVGYKPDAFFGTGGLTLRFTRLDSRSKAFVDKAAALRDRRRPSAAPAGGLAEASSPSLPSLPPPPLPLDEEPSGPGPSVSAPSAPDTRYAPAGAGDARYAPAGAGDLPAPEGLVAAPVSASPGAEARGPPAEPGDRDALIERLRARSKSLDEATVRRILDRRRQ